MFGDIIYSDSAFISSLVFFLTYQSFAISDGQLGSIFAARLSFAFPGFVTLPTRSC